MPAYRRDPRVSPTHIFHKLLIFSFSVSAKNRLQAFIIYLGLTALLDSYLDRY